MVRAPWLGPVSELTPLSNHSLLGLSTLQVFQKAHGIDLHGITLQIIHNFLYVFFSLYLQNLAQTLENNKQAHDKYLLNELIHGQLKE